VIVRVSCPRCGDLAVSVELIVVVCDESTGDSFRFTCEMCMTTVEKKALGRVADMLLAAGAQRLDRPPLTLAYLDTLRADLNADDWLDRLLLA